MCSTSRRDADAARGERVQHPRRERAAGARHLGAPGHAGEDRLVVGERPLAPGRARSGSARRARRGSRAAAGRASVELRRPTAGTADRTARRASPSAPPRSARTLARARVAHARRRRGAARRPSASPSRVRGVERWSWTAVAVRADGLSAAGSVADSLTTSRSPGSRCAGEVAERACAAAGGRRAATISRTASRAQPALLRRRARLERGRQPEVERRAHAGAPASARAA